MERQDVPSEGGRGRDRARCLARSRRISSRQGLQRFYRFPTGPAIHPSVPRCTQDKHWLGGWRKRQDGLDNVVGRRELRPLEVSK
jgi:hypothetical protein